MFDETIEVRFYVDKTGVSPYESWLGSLKDLRGKAAIDVRINRIRLANFGDCKFVGKGVYELRVRYGPGYRIYFGKIGNRVIVILSGGSKSNQGRDIKKAQTIWENIGGKNV